MVLAYIKLRKRNLAPILDANGWAVNAKAVINVPLGQSLTQIAELPAGSQRDLIDPFAAKKFPLALTLFILVVAGVLALGLGWYLGKLDPVLPRKYQKHHRARHERACVYAADQCRARRHFHLEHQRRAARAGEVRFHAP